VPCASCVEPLRVVAQEEGQDTVLVVDHALVGQYAIGLAAAAAAADTARDGDNYKTEVWLRVLCSFQKALRLEELLL
jgi:hypothetical protein